MRNEPPLSATDWEASSAAAQPTEDYRIAPLKREFGQRILCLIRDALPPAVKRASDDLYHQTFEETLVRLDACQCAGRRLEDWIREIAVELVQSYTNSAELDVRTLVAAKSGAPWARNLLVMKYSKRIYGLIWQVLPSDCKHAAEDLCHDAFAKALEKLGSFDLERSARPSTWISTIAIRLAINCGMRQKTSAPEQDIEQLPARGCPEEDASNRQLCERVARAMDALPNEQRALLILAADDVPHNEIAEILGLRTVEAVRTRLWRARAELREKVS